LEAGFQRWREHTSMCAIAISNNWDRPSVSGGSVASEMLSDL
jgi:hypothetical protein